MKRRVRFGVAWIAATAFSLLIAGQAVGSVGASVSDAPAPLVTLVTLRQPETPASSGTTLPITAAETTLPSVATSTTSTTDAPVATTEASSTTTTVTTTTTTAPPTTTQPPVAETYRLVGGWVRIVVEPGEIRLDGAAPRSGFTMRVKDSGPEKVEVEFESEDHESRFRAELDDGAVEVEIDESDDD